MTQEAPTAKPIWLAALALLLLITSLGCSVGRLLVGEPTPTPTPAPPTPLPTWTSLPGEALSPAEIATMTVVAGLAWPTLTPTITPIPSPTPTATLGSPATPTPPSNQPTPTPFVVVQAQVVNVREGPSVAYPVVGQVRSGDIYTVIGRNDTGTWWQICCFNGREVWISGELVEVSGDESQVLIVAAAGPPPPTPIPVPTQVPTATPGPSWSFDIGDGPYFFPSNNAWLTIWVMAYEGRPPIYLPVEGYRLKVFRNGVDVSSADTTGGILELWAPFDPDNPMAFGTRREYNLKYEYLPSAGEADWRVYLADAGGQQVSPQFTFRTGGDSDVREAYVGFFKRGQ